jgi:hypothetical protein
MEKLIIPSAYKYVAIAVMLAEINYCATRLNLPVELPIRENSLHVAHVSRPLITGFGGTLETDKYSFVFFKSGRLRQIIRINKFGEASPRELQKKLVAMSSMVDTNGAYQLATKWLAAIDVDVQALERHFHPSIQQTFFYPDATGVSDISRKGQRKVLLPIFHVSWGDAGKPVIIVSIFGPEKELLGIRQDDDSFSGRPIELLKNVPDLLAIPDSTFTNYSQSQLKELVTRFAAVDYQPNAALHDSSPRRNLQEHTQHDQTPSMDQLHIRGLP